MLHKNEIARIIAAAALLSSAVHLNAATLTDGSLIVTVNEFTGSNTAPTYVAEYTTSGSRLQILGNVPTPGGTGPTTDQARDLVLGPDNAIYLYNGTFTPYLARLDLGTGAWTQTTLAGWSTVNNLSYGGLAREGSFIYATNMMTGGGGSTQGVVRFDAPAGSGTNFSLTIQPQDLNIGPGSVLYAINGASSPTSTIFKYDLTTFASLGTVPIAFDDNRAVAVALDNSIFVATWDGVIKHYSATGSLLDSLTVPGAKFSDIDINSLGQIALGTGFGGEVVITDLSLDSFTRFRATDSTLGGDVFVAWVPEPTSGVLALLGAALVSCARRRGNR